MHSTRIDSIFGFKDWDGRDGKGRHPLIVARLQFREPVRFS